MKKRRKLRGYVIPTICAILIVTILFSSYKMYEIIEHSDVPVIDPVVKEENDYFIPTLNEQKSIYRPYTSEEVTASIPFYNQNGTDDEQKAALIYYDGIYMPNTGVLYTAPNKFDVISVLDGIVTDIKEDQIMGKVVTIENTSSLSTIYQSLGDVIVTIGSSVSAGSIIGTSGPNKISSDTAESLHFEVFYKGELINPEDFYLYNIEEITK